MMSFISNCLNSPNKTFTSLSNVTDSSALSETSAWHPIKAVLLSENQMYSRYEVTVPNNIRNHRVVISRTPNPTQLYNSNKNHDYMYKNEFPTRVKDSPAACNFKVDERLAKKPLHRLQEFDSNKKNYSKASGHPQGFQSNGLQKAHSLIESVKEQKYLGEASRNNMKATYSRPGNCSYNKELTNKDHEQRLQFIIKQLTTAREIEQQELSWNSYIDQLRMKHGFTKTKRYPHIQSSFTTSSSDQLTDIETVNNYIDNRLKTRQLLYSSDFLKKTSDEKYKKSLEILIQKNNSVNTENEQNNSSIFQKTKIPFAKLDCNVQKDKSNLDKATSYNEVAKENKMTEFKNTLECATSTGIILEKNDAITTKNQANLAEPRKNRKETLIVREVSSSTQTDQFIILQATQTDISELSDKAILEKDCKEFNSNIKNEGIIHKINGVGQNCKDDLNQVYRIEEVNGMKNKYEGTGLARNSEAEGATYNRNQNINEIEEDQFFLCNSKLSDYDNHEITDSLKEECDKNVTKKVDKSNSYSLEKNALEAIEKKVDLLLEAVNSIKTNNLMCYRCTPILPNTSDKDNRSPTFDVAKGMYGPSINYPSESCCIYKSPKKTNYRCNTPDCTSISCMRRRQMAENISKMSVKSIQDFNRVTNVQFVSNIIKKANDKFSLQTNFVNQNMCNLTKRSVELISERITEVEPRKKTTRRSCSCFKLQGNSDKLQVNNIFIEEIAKSNKIKRDIEEILTTDLKSAEPSWSQNSFCAVLSTVQFNFDAPTKDCCTEVTPSLSEEKIDEVIIEEVDTNSDKKTATAVNTEPLSLYALLKISTDNLRKLLKTMNFDYQSFLPLVQLTQLKQIPALTAAVAAKPRELICNVWGEAFIKAIQLTGQLQSDEDLSMSDCRVCRRLLEISKKSPRGFFLCRFCHRTFTRAYSRELHEQKCSKMFGKIHELPGNLAMLS